MFKISNPFLKNVITLVSGTALAQLITVIVYPISSRLFSPEDFGMVEVITSITAILTGIASLKYEQGIVLPRKDSEGKTLFNLSILLNFIFCLSTLLIIACFSGKIALWLDNVALQPYLFAVPFLVFFSALFTSLRFYAIRKKEFKLIAKVSVKKAIVGAITLITFGLCKLGSVGLIINQFCSSAFVNTGMYKQLVSNETSQSIWNWRQDKAKYLALLKKYVDFPKYSVAGTLANSLVLYGTNIFIFKQFEASILGQFALANRLLSMPLILISSAMSDVFIQRATEELHQKGNARESFLQILKPSVVIFLPVTVILYFTLPHLFAWVLGSQWFEAGQFSSIMIFLYAIRFVTSPLSSAIVVFNKQGYNLIGTSIQFGLTALTFFLVLRNHLNFTQYLYLTVVTQSIFYLGYLYFLWVIVNGKSRNEKTA